MKYVKYLFYAALALVLITVAFANRDPVELQLMPTGMTDLMGFQERMVLPLFVVILGSIAFGILVGFVWEWLREWGIRRTAEREARERRRLERENARLRTEVPGEEDDVVTLIERPHPAPAKGTAVAMR